MTDTSNEAASYDRPADAGKPPKGIVIRWCKEIDLQSRVEADWRKQGKAVLTRFRDEGQLERGAKEPRKLGTRFNILRPNTRVMKAAIYQECPKPDVRQRFKDRDVLAKAVSEVTERAVAFCTDKYDLDGALILAINDMLLPGRGVTRVRYEPQTAPQMQGGQPMLGPDQKPLEQITWEKCCFKHVNWEDFRRGPGRIWDEVPWVAFRARLTRDEAIEQIPEAAELLETIDLDCQLDMTDEDEKAVKDNPSLKDVFKRLTVWEIWDKGKRQQLFIAPSYKDKPLVVRDDPMGLEGFFDIPRPLYAVEESDTLIPLEDFRAYADQAKELDNVTARIDAIVRGLKVRGIYNSALKLMTKVMEAGDNELIPTGDEVSKLFNDGGLDKQIWMMPIEKIAGILQYLYEHREQTKQMIYEITGLSDIMRGSTKASETATAQSIKAQNGAISIQDRRKSVKRYARDLVRLAAEIICEHFQVETLKAMTGCDYPTEQEKQQIQAKMAMIQQQMAQQQTMGAAALPPADGGMQSGSSAPPVQDGAAPGMPSPNTPPPQPAGPPPEMVAQLEQMQERLAMPSWEQITEVMKSDALRSYRIDVETDETAFGDLAAEQQAVTELLAAVTQFLTAMAPLVQMQAVPPDFVKSMLLTAVRRFRVGREIEDAIEALADQQLQMPPPVDPNAGKVEMEGKRLEQEGAAEKERMGFEREKHQQTMGFERERFDAEMARAAKQDQFAERSHSDELSRRDREIDFNERNAGDERQSRERMAEIKSKPAVNLMMGANGEAQDMAEGTKGVAAAVQAMTEAVTALMQANIAAEARQAQSIQQMGTEIGNAIIRAATLDRVPERGKDGKIKKIRVVAPAASGSETRM